MKVETFGRYMGHDETHEETAERDKAETGALGKYTRSFGLSLAITSVLSALLVVLKELNEGVLGWMKGATPHHWITHGVFDLLAFVIIGIALSQLHGGEGVRVSTKGIALAIVGSVTISGLIIAGFYLILG
jgi:hypothetical protein